MPAAQRQQQALRAESLPREGRPRKKSAKAPKGRRRIHAGHRRFLVLVVVPVVLMLGSVYLHTVAAGLTDRVKVLEAKNAKTSVEGEKLAVKVAKSSSPERILKLARHELGMKDPDGKDLKVYGKTGEDVPPHGGEQAKEEAR